MLVLLFWLVMFLIAAVLDIRAHKRRRQVHASQWLRCLNNARTADDETGLGDWTQHPSRRGGPRA